MIPILTWSGNGSFHVQNMVQDNNNVTVVILDQNGNKVTKEVTVMLLYC